MIGTPSGLLCSHGATDTNPPWIDGCPPSSSPSFPQEAAGALLALRPTLVTAASLPSATFTELPPSLAAVARSVAWAVSALAERDACDETCSGLALRPNHSGAAPDTTRGDLPMGLAELMLLCLSSTSRAIADAALDYFASVNTVTRPFCGRPGGILDPSEGTHLPVGPLFKSYRPNPPRFPSLSVTRSCALLYSPRRFPTC